ncbi:cryptococcal mannosyltransferase 1-domain-containing protein [Aspergillus heterothallicus]
MSAPFLRAGEYELNSRSSVGYERLPDFDGDQVFWQQEPPRPSWFSRKVPQTFARFWPFRTRRQIRVFTRPFETQSRLRSRHNLNFLWLTRIALGYLLACIIFTAAFFPSYTHVPPHYKALRQRVQNGTTHGVGNVRNETVFIAAVLYDPTGKIAQGPWGRALLRLIDLLGEENVFLSIYENNSGGGRLALESLADKVSCNHSIISEPGLALHGIPRVVLPGVSNANRALRPLERQDVPLYDKLLYLNDVVFDPVEALQLLFCTNADADGVAQYRAACAVDFTNPFKFYDTYATRDLEGYEMGLPFYPWFTAAGDAQSRQDVLAGEDAVRVQSCWGGMVAFDAHFFQKENPVRFRAVEELFWDASECCLIHADIQKAMSDAGDITDSGIYMNPFVRVAYDVKTFQWLWTTRRFERLYPLVHGVVSNLARFPWVNPRRAEVPGQRAHHTVWMREDGANGGEAVGSWKTVEREATNDGFCGRRGLEVVVEDRKAGQDGFETVPIPHFPII